MLLLATFDLSGADIALFEEYEAAVLPLLARHGGRLLQRVRSLDSRPSRSISSNSIAKRGSKASASTRTGRRRKPLFERCRAESVLTPVRSI